MPLKDRTVLIADDDPIFLRLLSQFLIRLNYHPIEATDGDQALLQFEAHSPAFVLLDGHMPGKSGIEVATMITQHIPSENRPPILIITADENPEYIESCFSAGATDYLKKPLNWTVLKNRLDYLYQLKRQKQKLIQQQVLLQSAQKIAKIGYLEWNLTTNDQTWSPILIDVLDWPKDQRLSIQSLLAQLRAKDRYHFEVLSKQGFTYPHPINFEFDLPIQNQVSRRIHLIGQITLSNNNEPVLLATLQDISQQAQQAQKIWYQANYDSLTDLRNRTAFFNDFDHDLKLAHHHDEPLAIMFLDLDFFKQINDTLGHDVGDALLIEVSQRLKTLVQEHISFARLGGDEFAVLISQYQDAKELSDLAQSILCLLEQPMQIGSLHLSVSGSIGIATYPHDGEDTTQLLKHADTAMYSAKASGRNHYAFFSPDMHEKLVLRNQLEKSIRRALANNEFQLVYQPQMDIQNHKIIGVEALIRWQDSETGAWVRPDHFIPTAEESSLICDIDLWVMDQVCKQLQAWQSKRPDMQLNKMSFNITGKTLVSPRFIDALEHIKALFGDQPVEQLTLEITERTLLDMNANQAIFDRIREQGFRVAIDDFGTGFSSLNYLANLPAQDMLKLDKSFIERIGQSQKSDALVSSIIDLARSLEIEVVAEGVETAEQFAFLKQAGCRYIQGFYLAKGLSPTDFMDFFDQFEQLRVN
jgi:diguanylate cyclase (GGDEF)-like protein